MTLLALSWVASTDNVGVTGYQVLVNGVLRTTVTGTTTTVTGLTANTAYALVLRAKDAAGNVSLPATVALNPASADTFVSSISQSTNYGTRTTLSFASPSSGENRWTYLRFPVPAAPTTISAATLRLTGSASRNSGLTLDAYSVTSDTWTETGLTWRNKPGLGSTRLSVSPRLQNTSVAAVDLDVTAAVKAARVAGASTVSIAVKPTGTTTLSYSAYSRQATAGQPMLLVTG